MMTKLIPTFSEDTWVRRCNECGHIQPDNKPLAKAQVEGMTPGYRARKCKKCKSHALDYGTLNGSNENWAD